jgi:uncharacterized protein CbrC (UPF0167 family)
MDLPEFSYHPDPVATGAVVASDAECMVCGQRRGAIYVGPAYSREELNESVCPWCIADGTAAERFDAFFLNVDEAPDDVPRDLLLRLERTTPGFLAWQDPQWMFHCGDGAAYLGMVDGNELAAHPEAFDMLREEYDEDELRSLRKDGDASAYLFRCRHCGTHLAYVDFS